VPSLGQPKAPSLAGRGLLYGPPALATAIAGKAEHRRTIYSNRAREGLRNMHHFYPRGAFYLACMAAGVVLTLLFYFWSEEIWALWVWLWT
jgi:hypothetical protein